MPGTLCQGVEGGDYANITNIFVACGLMVAIPQRQDSSLNLLFNSGGKWSQRLYSCASAVKATIKTVNFHLNGTQGLKSLSVTSVEAKVFPDDTSKPLWGVENTGNRYKISQLPMIWGLVSSAYENNENVSTVRQESLYLPGYLDFSEGLMIGTQIENLAASDFLYQLWRQLTPWKWVLRRAVSSNQIILVLPTFQCKSATTFFMARSLLKY